MSLALTNRALCAILKDRASQLAKARSFFAQKEVLEVDVPILSYASSIDLHIDVIEVACCGKKGYLHTSPEYGMKRLLAEGIGDIYQISHVFRDNEQGVRHTVEFVMVEWYRIAFTFQEMIRETVNFIELFLKLPQQIETLTYRDAFIHFAGHYPPSIEEQDRVFAFEVEPHLGEGHLTVISDFPPGKAALAALNSHGVAMRFEIYYQGVELANGYHELINPQEQRHRLKISNQQREKQGKTKLPIDEEFIEALEKGLPDCCGVAVGFDRLMMLRHQLEDIRETSCFFI
jgi:lysyl-tRNA synthetase class 2